MRKTFRKGNMQVTQTEDKIGISQMITFLEKKRMMPTPRNLENMAGVKDFKWRCSKCKKVAHPDEYLSDLRCKKCGEYGLERNSKKGEWVLTI